MIKLLKYLFGLVLVLVLLLVVAVIVIPMVVDPNDFRDDIIAQVKQHTGRDLAIDGDIGLSVFPWLGVDLAALTLSQPPGFGDEPFAVVKQAQVRAKLMPLLKRQLEVDAIQLAGLRLNLMRNSQGLGNWEDLAAAEQQAESQTQHPTEGAGADKGGEAMAGFALGGVQIDDARVSWDDRQAGQKLVVEDLRLAIGAVTPEQPIDIDLAFAVNNAAPAVQARLGLTGALRHYDAGQVLEIKPLLLKVQELKTADGLSTNAVIQADLLFDVAKQHLSLQNLGIEKDVSGGPLKGMAVSSTLKAGLTADLAAQIFQLEGLRLSSRLEGHDVPGGSLELQLAAQVAADLGQDTLKVEGLDLRLADLHLVGHLQGVKLQSAPSVTGHIALDEVNLKTLLGKLDIPAPETADPDVLQRFSLSSDLKADQKQAVLENLALGLDDSNLSGQARILLTSVPGYRFALNLDAIDLDRYLPPTTEAAPVPDAETAAAPARNKAVQPLFPVDSLRQLDVDGRFSIGHLVINKLTLDKAQITVKAKDGEVKILPKVGAFYRGSLDGSLGVNVRGKTPKVNILQHVKGVQAESLIKDLIGEDRLAGTGNFNANLNAAGQSVEAIKRSLGGNLDFAFTEGAVKGFNLGRMLREAVANLKGQTLPEDDEANETDFSLLKGSAVIAQGVLKNDDLSAKSPLFRITGKGSVDIGNDTLDYKIKPVLVASISGQGGEDLDKLKGVPIPVHLSGPLAKPNWRIDLAEALTESQKAKAQEKLQKELEKRIPKDLQEQIPGGLQKQLDGVFKGFFN